MRNLVYGLATMIVLGGCAPTWPEKQFPAQMGVERTLFAEEETGLREGCVAIVVELTDASAMRVIYAPKITKDGPWAASPRNKWRSTPMVEADKRHRFYTGAFGGCNSDGHTPLGDLPDALDRPGAFYKIVNGGEGIAIIVPRAKLAGYFYSG